MDVHVRQGVLQRGTPMPLARLSALAASLVLASTVVAGCAADEEEEEDPVHAGEEELVAERQLFGNELPDKTLSLTFDDGPGPRTGELADWLATKGIKATFFINGKNVPGRQELVDKIVARGHLLANHTQHHLQLTSLSSAKVIDEVEDTDAFIVDAQPRGPFVLRAPFGAWNGTVTRTINRTPMKKYVGSVFWDVGGELTTTTAADWACWGKGVSIARCGELYMNEMRAKRRGIVLMHDIHGKTIDMVKEIVPKLLAQGWKFVPLTSVPSVKRALDGRALPAQPDDSCESATLGRSVAEDVCVQARSDSKWYRCLDGDWIGSTATDTKCARRYPL
jgi:peptidoglycan/xylan/chitin deacetylase (PgdA/CDA1 family)